MAEMASGPAGTAKLVWLCGIFPLPVSLIPSCPGSSEGKKANVPQPYRIAAKVPPVLRIWERCGRRLCGLRIAPPHQPCGAGGAQAQRDPLRGIEGSAPQVALLVVAEELHHEAHRAVEQQVEHDDFSAAMWFADAPVEQGENCELREGFVKLVGMERHVERHAD